MNTHCCGNLRFHISKFSCWLSGHKNKQLMIYYCFQTSAIFWMLYAFFWVNLQYLNFICQCFGTLRLFHLHRRVVIPVSFIPLACAECDDTLLFSGASSIPLCRTYTYLPIKFRCRGITQQKSNNSSWFNFWIKNQQMQQYADIYVLQSYSTCFGCHSTHHQEY